MLRFLLTALSALVLLACDTDVTQNFAIPYTEQLVIESFISPQDTLIEVRVMKTAPSVGKVDRTVNTRILTDARVELSNGTNTVRLPFGTYITVGKHSVSGYFLKTSKFPIESGQTYTLRVSVPSGLSAQAQCTVPVRNLTLNQVEVKRGTSLQEGKQLPTVQIRVKDAAGITNRYSVVIHQTAPKRYPTVTEYLTDNNRNGDWLSTPEANLPVKPGDRFELFLATTDVPYYEYNTTIKKNRDSHSNPFAEPQPLYSNVSGGLGVFAAYQWVRLPL